MMGLTIPLVVMEWPWMILIGVCLVPAVMDGELCAGAAGLHVLCSDSAS